MTITTEEELEGLRKIGRIVADCLHMMSEALEPGMTTQELDQIGERYLAQHGANPAPRLTYNFPGATCISVNRCVAHGIPNDLVLKPSDMVNIDVSAELNGFFADTGGSFIIPPHKARDLAVCRATKEALKAAMNEVRSNQPLNVIGKAVERVAKKHGLTIIENLGSHGVGRALHEEPESIPSFYNARDKRRLHKGLVITIEPFLSNGAKYVDEGSDGWSLLTPKNFVAAQYEHTMVITDGKPLVMTLPSHLAA